MSGIDPDVLRKVRGLLAMAEGTDNPLEAEAFSAKAAEMIDKYRIDVASLRPEGTAPGYGKTTFPMTGVKYLRASVNLLSAVATHYGVVILIGATGNSKNPVLVGTEMDVQATTMLFRSLLIQRDRECLAADADKPRWQNTNEYRNSFCYGYAATINMRLRALRERQRTEARADGNTAALAVFDRENAVTRWLEEERGKALKSANQNKPTIDPAAASQGRLAAQLADLGQDRLPSAGPRAIGR